VTRPRARLHAACCTPVAGGLCARSADHEGDCDPRVAHEDGRTWTLRMVPPDVDMVAVLTEIRQRVAAADDDPLQDYGSAFSVLDDIDEVAARALGQKVEEVG